MANIIRCKLPSGPHRFKPFKVSDYRDLLLVRNDMEDKSEQEQKEILDGVMLEYFGEYPESWRPYIFLKVLTSSIGKDKIPVVFTCPTCGKQHKIPFNLEQGDLVDPMIETAGLKIKFNFPDDPNIEPIDLIKTHIKSVADDQNQYNWENLTPESKLQVIEAIDLESLKELTKQLTPINCKLRMRCCEDKLAEYTDIVDVFNIVVNPDEVFIFYQINHLLVKSNYDNDSIMNMIPIERTIALSLIEKDNKK